MTIRELVREFERLSENWDYTDVMIQTPHADPDSLYDIKLVEEFRSGDEVFLVVR